APPRSPSKGDVLLLDDPASQPIGLMDYWISGLMKDCRTVQQSKNPLIHQSTSQMVPVCCGFGSRESDKCQVSSAKQARREMYARLFLSYHPLKNIIVDQPEI